MGHSAAPGDLTSSPGLATRQLWSPLNHLSVSFNHNVISRQNQCLFDLSAGGSVDGENGSTSGQSGDVSIISAVRRGLWLLGAGSVASEQDRCPLSRLAPMLAATAPPAANIVHRHCHRLMSYHQRRVKSRADLQSRSGDI